MMPKPPSPLNPVSRYVVPPTVKPDNVKPTKKPNTKTNAKSELANKNKKTTSVVTPNNSQTLSTAPLATAPQSSKPKLTDTATKGKSSNSIAPVASSNVKHANDNENKKSKSN